MSDNIYYYPILKSIYHIRMNNKYDYFSFDLKDVRYHSLTSASKILTKNVMKRINTFIILKLELINPEQQNDKYFLPKFKLIDTIDGNRVKLCATLY